MCWKSALSHGTVGAIEIQALQLFTPSIFVSLSPSRGRKNLHLAFTSLISSSLFISGLWNFPLLSCELSSKFEKMLISSFLSLSYCQKCKCPCRFILFNSYNSQEKQLCLPLYQVQPLEFHTFFSCIKHIKHFPILLFSLPGTLFTRN